MLFRAIWCKKHSRRTLHFGSRRIQWKLVCQKRIIEPGIEYNGETQIKSGISAGDRIITVGYNELVDGQQIAL